MSLKKLTIEFSSIDNLFRAVDNAIRTKKNLSTKFNSIQFDSIDTYRTFMTANKANILCAISKMKPSSVYELAKCLNRKPQHVLADCRSLESHGFIHLIQDKKGRKSVRPLLIFEYDVIMIDDKGSMPLALSEKSQRVLARAAS